MKNMKSNRSNPSIGSSLKLLLSSCARRAGKTALLTAALLGLASNGFAQSSNTVSAGVFNTATATPPAAGPYDIVVTNFTSNVGPAGLNYYTDNGTPPGQTFTTLSDAAQGYQLTDVYVKTDPGGGGNPTTDPYVLRIFSLTNAQAGNATLLTAYTTTNTATVTVAQGTWLRISGLTNILATNTAYAFSLRNNNSRFWRLANSSASPNGPYTNGRSALFPTTATGAMSFGSGSLSDAAFDVALFPWGNPLVTPTVISPNSVFAGPTVTLSATFSGTAPFTSFVWQSDGGSSGVTWTNLLGSTTNTYSLNTTGMAANTNQYRLIVTGGAGTTTNVPASLVVKGPSAPFILSNTAVSPGVTFVGNTVLIGATFDGSAPITYQWQFSNLATFTNNISGATNNTYTISDAATANTGSYRVVAANGVGSSNSAFASLTVTNTSVGVQILNLGATTPVASGFDIAQLSTVGNQGAPSGGLNYYSDNGTAPGQAFTTGTNDDGYLLTSLYIQWGTINGSHAAANPYTLRIYSVAGTAVTLLQTYTNNNSAAAMATGNWTKWIGLSNVLAPNSVYAYSIRARSESGAGAGFMQVMNSDPNPYSGGQLGLFPATSGTANYGNSADDATFLIHLASAPPSAPVIQSVNIAPANSVTNPVFVGSPVTLSTVAVGSSPKAYQWLADNGTGGATFTPISGATSNPYVLDTSSLSPSTQYQYQVIVTNSAGSATSSSVVLNLTNASGPLVVTATVITPSVVIVGNNTTMTGSFKGSLPITYQWQHAGTNVPGATSNSFAITGAQFTDAGTYSLVASNNPPGIGPTTASSAAILYVVNPPETNNANASIADGGTSPFVGSYDVFQLTDGTVTPPGLNYYVDNARPPGQIFTTSNTPPTPAGYPLNYVYVKHDTGGTGTGYSVSQTYTLRIYQMLDGTNAQLLTSYITTNAAAFSAGDWVRIGGLTNMLKTNTTYAFGLSRNTSGFWRLACNVAASSSGNGQAVSLPVLGGAATLSSPDATFGLYYDAAFVAGMTPATAPTELSPMTINPSSIHTGQGPVVMTASFIGSQPITYQWQHAGTNLPGATATTYTIPVVSVAHDGTYVCLASNSYSLGTPTSSTSQYLTVDPTVQTGLINPTTRNGSFELISGNPGGTTKVNISTGTVDNWKTWPAFPNSGDTGADDDVAATDGTRIAFLQGDSGIYNMAGQIIAAGDSYSYTWDWVLTGRGPAVVHLGYWDGTNVVLIPGTDSSAPGGTGPLLGLGTNYTILAGDPAIGHPVVLTVNAPSGANYPEVDNINLTVVPAGTGLAPFVVADTAINPARSFVGSTVVMSASFNGTAPIRYQWNFDNGGGAVPIAGATNSTYTIASASLGNSGSYYLTATNAYAPYTASSSAKSLLVFSPPQNNTTGAGLFDATSVAPTAGPNDIAQLITASPTTVPGINYYVDNGNPPGQTFTTLGAFTNGYQLHSIYMQEDVATAGGGGLNPGIYRLGIYAITDTNAVLLTSYDSTNQPTLTAGNWMQWVGLTNILATNQTYAFSMQKQTGGGYWKLAANSTATDLYSDGRSALLPGSGLGGLAFSTDTTIDAGFLIGLSAVSTVATNPTNITSVVHGGNLELSWPADHIGWRLQSQTNTASVGLSTNWADVAGSTTVNSVTNTINPANGAVFYRMVYP
jgi:hypothetical protein